jgi:hypothetical protein
MVAAAATVAAACGTAAPAPDLPRTTERDVTIAVTEAVETLPIPGCHSFWTTRGQTPPPGACEQTTTVARFLARRGAEQVEAVVMGSPTADPLYAMQLASRSVTDVLSVVVVIPPAGASVLRLTNDSGEVVDRVSSTAGLVALAGPGADLTVEALAGDGTVVAACPPEGITVAGVTYACTLAAPPPVTTTTLADTRTP